MKNNKEISQISSSFKIRDCFQFSFQHKFDSNKIFFTGIRLQFPRNRKAIQAIEIEMKVEIQKYQ